MKSELSEREGFAYQRSRLSRASHHTWGSRMALPRKMNKEESVLEGSSSICSPASASSAPAQVYAGSSQAPRRKGLVILKAWGTQRQADDSRVVTVAGAGEGKGMQTAPYHRPLGSGRAWGSHHAPVTL